MMKSPKPRVQFPELLALHNPFARNAFKMVFKEAAEILATAEIPKGAKRTKILDHPVMANVCDILFIHRFYSRLLKGTLPDQAMLTITFDGVVSAEGFLSSFYLPPLLDIESKYAWKEMDKIVVYPAVGYNAGNAFLNEQRGIMLPSGFLIEAFLDPGPVKKEAKLEVGLVGATYTTRGIEGGGLVALKDGRKG